MKAVKNFAAVVNGRSYRLRKGQEFNGDALATRHFMKLGLISDAAEKGGRKAAKAD